MTISVDVAATIAAVAGLVTVVGQVVSQIMQFRAQTEAREGRVKLNDKVDVAVAKVDETAAKVDANTALTQDTNNKVEVVHAATTAIAEATGTHQAMRDDG